MRKKKAVSTGQIRPAYVGLPGTAVELTAIRTLSDRHIIIPQTCGNLKLVLRPKSAAWARGRNSGEFRYGEVRPPKLWRVPLRRGTPAETLASSATARYARRNSGEFRYGEVHPPKLWRVPLRRGTPAETLASSATARYAHRNSGEFRYEFRYGPFRTQRCPACVGNGITSRILAMPVMNWTTRSRPRPKPACGTVPNRRKSRYHQ